MRYTKATLQKIEQILQEASYRIYYEKGSFQSGYCLVKEKKTIVINKFFDTEARIHVLSEILTAAIPEIAAGDSKIQQFLNALDRDKGQQE
jgi:hypothetical protein